MYSLAKDKVFSTRNITSAWAVTGLFRLNLDRVLRRIPKSPAQLTVLRPDEIRGDSGLPDEVTLLQTPIILVSAEAFILLYNLIKQDTYTLNKTSIPRL